MTKRSSLILLACVLAMVLACNGTSSVTRTPRPLHSEGGARVVCKNFVRDRLKAPATAKFSGYGETQTYVLGGGRSDCYVVEGYVDAQNAFGALLRTHYRCTVCSTGEREVYRLESLRMQ